MTSQLHQEHSQESSFLALYWRYFPALLYTVFVTILLLQPSNQPLIGPPAPPGPPSFRREVFLTIGHLCVFSGLLTCWWWALLPTHTFERALRTSVVACIVFGIVSELLQTFSVYRSVSVIDASANIGAVLLTAWAINVYRSRR
ncbi:MAG: VanZ family protein [Anaerolineae bacterium]|nr:VanZ family protein [Anaerolineae bacterium]